MDDWETGEVIKLRDNIRTASPAEITEMLQKSFGHTTDPTLMNNYSVMTGGYGLEGFMTDIVLLVLDQLPLHTPTYDAVYTILDNFCGVLAKRMDIYVSVSYSVV